MNYGVSDSRGMDDDLQPAHQNRFGRSGRVSSNGRSMVGGDGGGGGGPRPPLRRMQDDMESQIHLIEQEAYSSVLRAFRAQSDALTWEKQDFITDVRKELNVSDEEHREILSRVNSDEMIRRIREWRKMNGMQPCMFAAPQLGSASLKKQKVFQSGVVPSPAMQQSMLPTSDLKRGPPTGGKGKKTKSMPLSNHSGRVLGSNHGALGDFVAKEPSKTVNHDPLIGRKVLIRWPEDNAFYEAVIKEYNPTEGTHALLYGMHTLDEALEWVNLKQMSPEDIKWVGEDLGTSQRVPCSGVGDGTKKGPHSSGPGRDSGPLKGQSKKDSFLSQNGVGRKASGDIELLHTDTLIKEVEIIFNDNPDPTEVEKAKQVLKEHEQALLKAIARIEESSNPGIDGEHPFLQGRATDQDQGWRKRQYSEMGRREGRGTEGLSCENIVF